MKKMITILALVAATMFATSTAQAKNHHDPSPENAAAHQMTANNVITPDTFRLVEKFVLASLSKARVTQYWRACDIGFINTVQYGEGFTGSKSMSIVISWDGKIIADPYSNDAHYLGEWTKLR